MQSTPHHAPRRARNLVSRARPFVTGAFALAATFGLLHSSAAAEIDLSGTGTFKPPSAEQLASLPADMAFSRADFASGTWSFRVRYAERTPDADPDPYVGRFGGAVRVFQLTLGATTIDLPVDRAELVVSDGGSGFPNRESIRLETGSSTPYGVMRIGWIQLNQPPKGTDLRGAPGSLTTDSLPEPSMIANLPTSSPFDRFLLLRIDRPGGGAQPLIYISSSQFSVLASPAAIR